MVIDIELPDNDHTLPEDFPNGWDSDARITTDSDVVEETSSMLNLSASKLQKDVR